MRCVFLVFEDGPWAGQVRENTSVSGRPPGVVPVGLSAARYVLTDLREMFDGGEGCVYRLERRVRAPLTPVALGARPSGAAGDLAPTAASVAAARTRTVPGGVRWAVMLVLPYLLLGLMWAMSNPPGAAPDESDHLVKALGAGRLSIGVASAINPLMTSLGERRNESIARTVLIPARLAPDGFNCTAFHSDASAACLPGPGSVSTRLVPRRTNVGSYPVFGYLPLGLLADLAHTPRQAYYLGRIGSGLMGGLLLFLALWQLTRWLGRGSAVGVAVGMTPMAVFAWASVSTSGLEIMSAAAVAAVVVVATRRPESLRTGGTLVVLAGAGAGLALSRQLGVVSLAVLAVVALLGGAGPVVWSMLRRRDPRFLATVGVITVAVAAVIWWELKFDHPVLTGPVIAAGAVKSAARTAAFVAHSGVGVFGWLDTPLPLTAIRVWEAMALLLVAAAFTLGTVRDKMVIASMLAAVAITFVITYDTVFYPIGADVQGRHLLPMFQIIPMLSGVVLAERLAKAHRRFPRRVLYWSIAMMVAALQGLSLLVNARRYAVGDTGPILFLSHAGWSPPLGWLTWLIPGIVAAIWLGITIGRSAAQPSDQTHRSTGQRADQPSLV